MRRFVRVLVAAAVGAVSLTITPEAIAGGGNWIDIAREYNPVGSKTTVRADFYGPRKGTIDLGPYYVFLERLDHTGMAWDLPRVGRPDVVRVGKVTIAWDKNPRFLPGGAATATFTVPDVETGRYLMSMCDRGCENRLGDIDTSGYFWT